MADEELTVLPDQHSYRSRTPEMENKYEPRTASPVRSENDVGFSFRGAATRIADDRNMGNVRNMPEYRLLPASVVEARPRQPPWRTDQREATHRSLQATSDNLYHPQLNLTRHEATETTGFLVGGAGHEQPYSNPSWNAKPSFYGHYGNHLQPLQSKHILTCQQGFRSRARRRPTSARARCRRTSTNLSPASTGPLMAIVASWTASVCKYIHTLEYTVLF